MFREYLYGLRKERGLSQAKVAAKIGHGQSYYNAIENGDRQQNMDFSIMELLAKAFNISEKMMFDLEMNYRKQKNAAQTEYKGGAL